MAYGFPSSEVFINMDLKEVFVIAFLYEIKFYRIKLVNNEQFILEDLHVDIDTNRIQI